MTGHHRAIPPNPQTRKVPADSPRTQVNQPDRSTTRNDPEQQPLIITTLNQPWVLIKVLRENASPLYSRYAGFHAICPAM